MDKFFIQKNCDRCGGSLADGRQMSRFNTDCLCHRCIEEEHQHPDYQKAAEVELAELRAGNRNYSGIGYPGKNGRVR